VNNRKRNEWMESLSLFRLNSFNSSFYQLLVLSRRTYSPWRSSYWVNLYE